MNTFTKENSILIYERPDNYFFPYLDNIYSPYKKEGRSLPYYIYRLMNIAGMQASSFYWGEWKRHIPGARKVIIFDYGYQRGMEKYIRRINPDCKVYLFLWNKVDAVHNVYKYYSDKENIYSIFGSDCDTYGFKSAHTFFASALRQKKYSGDTRAFFLGADKGRGPYIAHVAKRLSDIGLPVDVHLVSTGEPGESSYSHLISDKRMSYPDYLKTLDKYGFILDIPANGADGLTLRVMESVFLSKKLITTNSAVKSCDLYEYSNIFVMPEDPEDLSEEDLFCFIETDFSSYPKDIIRKYDENGFLDQF